MNRMSASFDLVSRLWGGESWEEGLRAVSLAGLVNSLNISKGRGEVYSCEYLLK